MLSGNTKMVKAAEATETTIASLNSALWTIRISYQRKDRQPALEQVVLHLGLQVLVEQEPDSLRPEMRVRNMRVRYVNAVQVRPVKVRHMDIRAMEQPGPIRGTIGHF